MAWGLGVDGRPADGLQAPHRAPKALCGSCDGGQQVLHQPVGRGEEDRPARFHQPVAHGAQGVCFPGAGQSEGQDVDAAIDEVAAGQFPQLLLQA